ncbi:MAG: hypothetical protein FJ397_11265 [Verrucomicrobia bacterium]|nr:hypothetical protein [Verrucomicrobiota bacterium]
MSVAQLRQELSKLSAEEKLALADYLVRQAEASAEAPASLVAERDRRLAEGLAHPERLLSPEEVHRGLVR